MVAFYFARFKSHLKSGEAPLNAGTAHFSDSTKDGNYAVDGLLVITNQRIFHCIDFGPLTMEVRKQDILKVVSSKHPIKGNKVLQLSYSENGEITGSTFFCSKLFTREVVRMLKGY